MIAYQVEAGEGKLPDSTDTFTGENALPAAQSTYERLKAANKNVRLTYGYIDDHTQEYTATHLLLEYFRKRE